MARKPVTVSLPSDLVKNTSAYCRKWSVTLSEITRDALRQYLYEKEIDSVRRTFTTQMVKDGISSEKQLLDRLEDR